MKRLLAVVGVAVLAAVSFFWWKKRHTSELPAGIASGNGRVEATQTDVAAKYAGRVKEILVREGDLVTEDQILVTMDTSELNAQLANGEAKVQEAEAQLSSAQARIQEAEAQLSSAKASIKQAEADAEALIAQVRKGESNLVFAKQQLARAMNWSPRK